MSDKNVPDKATSFDDDLDIPTYNADAKAEEKPTRSRLFKRAGRAEPQEIKPNAQTVPETALGEEEAEEEATETRQFETLRAEDPKTEKVEKVEEVPEPVYGDEDFATAAMPASAADLDEDEESVDETAVETNEDEQVRRDGYREYGRRGTIDFGLLFVRIALSAYLLIAGATTFFKLGGGEGLSGLETDFADYAFASPLAIAVPTMQLIAGAFLLLGLVTPFAAMIGLVVTGFMALHELAASGAGLDIFNWPDSVWLSLVLFVIAVALQFTGPGFISFDAKRSWARRPLATSWIFVVIGIAVLVALWWFGAAVNPLA
ncbi:DoxX family protein [Corynebacterium sp. HMSC08C04]|uniref:DoxX family protein n=1 Tax=unclassified Corynebacterium TaxID=2624378 RepID=UPI0008A22282|nr:MULTISPECIES: DoxX family protein [unclassified Corynebacterium]OFM00893.1 DoxX family protein [Corynebacterium sp. HMSC071F07]OFT32585.1 DoxX family protein [Corynebacterium sp. HMSC08C04]